ncbi:DUF4335 domain-containing protein [Nodosilinea sp. PGN35]|uniref:DUF4335 domain-containing protein n=1 Tax=Nodosilinea sp. PGN35 TaxID=3020489 RepID=UPI0023B2823B|nr:DUF4335 domain-containing protein [Nodosilinea sp. TSF1-S3]MDF0366701.1 DUF4335 domain-containing protein [Nodosilinea sp. TSF1-S3]
MAPTATITSYEYAAGSCTLRLIGELSPLSQVTDRPVLARSRFHLQVHGEETTQDVRTLASRAVTLETSGREPEFSALADLVQTYVQNQLSADALAAGGAVSRGESSLQPVGLTRHRLTLAISPDPLRVVELSTLQLSDLADALEQAEGNLQLLPDGAKPKARRVRPQLPLWLGSVAAVGIAALLGNQFLTTAPSPVVLSPSEPQPLNGAADSAAPEDRQLSLEAAPDSGADAADSVAPAPAAGEALPAPATTAPTTPTPPASVSGGAETPKVSPTPAVPSAPGARSPQVSPAPAPSPEAARIARPDADPASESGPAPERALAPPPASPETFDASPSITAASAPDTALEWISNLTQALEQQWRPPSNLAAPLRYRLTLEPDGTVTALDPLNDFSATYQSNATLPQLGDSVPGVARDAVTTVEVQFLPTGEVVVVPPDGLNP